MAFLELKGVSKSFINTGTDEITEALRDCDLAIEDGEFISIVGPSGCGKSTILRLIAGLIPPTSGEILLENKKVEGPHPERGMVFQQATLFPWLTVRENVSFSQKLDNNVDEKEVTRLIDSVSLSNFENAYPHQLSGGMAQRVSLIRSMILHPKVFLLDEPLGALDAFTRMNIQDELLDLWQKNKHVMIMVTHDVDEAIYMSNRVIVMEANPGRVKNSITIDLPYPRERTSDDFIDYRVQIMEELEL